MNKGSLKRLPGLVGPCSVCRPLRLTEPEASSRGGRLGEGAGPTGGAKLGLDSKLVLSAQLPQFRLC